MLVHHGAEQDGDEARGLLRARERGHGGDRILLVRKSRGATPVRRSFADLTDLGLRQEDDVPRRFPHGPRRRAESAGQFAQPCSVRVPRKDGLGEFEVAGEESEHRRTIRTERRQRSGGPAVQDLPAIANVGRNYRQRCLAILQ